MTASIDAVFVIQDLRAQSDFLVRLKGHYKAMIHAGPTPDQLQQIHRDLATISGLQDTLRRYVNGANERARHLPIERAA